MRFRHFLALVVLGAMPAAAWADVEVGFWSRELGLELPHAFFTIKGTIDGRPVEESYGYTPKTITPAILWGPVPGRIDLTTKGYMAASHRHFSVIVPDSVYPKLKALVERYGTRPGSIYRMEDHNCVTFVGEAAQTVGLKVPFDRKLLKRPTSFLAAVAAANPGFPNLQMASRK